MGEFYLVIIPLYKFLRKPVQLWDAYINYTGKIERERMKPNKFALDRMQKHHT